MAKSKTSANIAKINTYLQNIADVWSIYSNEYEQAVSKLKTFDLRTTKSGVLQIRDTKQNRKQHQKIRTLSNKKVSKKVMQNKFKQRENRLAKKNKKLSKETIKKYKDAEDDFSNAYKKIKEAQERLANVGLDYNKYLDILRSTKDAQLALDTMIFDYNEAKEIQESVTNSVSRETIETEFGLIDAETGELIYEY